MPNQADLPAIEGEGVAPKRIKAIEAAMEKYTEVRDERMKWTKKEIEAKDKLIGLMKEHGLEVYIYDDQKAYLEHKADNVKVRTVDGEAPEQGED